MYITMAFALFLIFSGLETTMNDKKFEGRHEGPVYIDGRLNIREDGRLPAAVEDMLRRRIRENQPAYPDPMVPPWEYLPDLPRFSMGWRMGSGEQYNNDFADWLMALSKENYIEFLAKNLEPSGWEGYYALLVARTIPSLE